MIDPRAAVELQRLVAALTGHRSFALHLGDPGLLAGDPAVLQVQAQVHRDTASTLRSVQVNSHPQVLDVVGSLWDGAASAAFLDYWNHVHGTIGDLAAHHDQMASALQGMAVEAGRLNRHVVTVLESIGVWLNRASGMAIVSDVAAMGELVAEGKAIASHWHELLVDVEAFAGGVGRRLAASLEFRAKGTTAMSMPLPRRPRPVDGLPPPMPPVITVLPPKSPRAINRPFPGSQPPLINVPPAKSPRVPDGPLPGGGKPGSGNAGSILDSTPLGGLFAASKRKRGGRPQGNGSGQPPVAGKKPKPEPGQGPSGKPKVYVKRHPTPKRAKDAARNEGKRAPIRHPSPQAGDRHFHATDQHGNKIPGSTHHVYPKR
jgi:uncharacterized protein YukE